MLGNVEGKHLSCLGKTGKRFQQSSIIRILIWQLGCYSTLIASRMIPAIRITIPRIVNIPETWLMSPGGGLLESNATNTPMMMSVIPNSFSISFNPMGVSAVMPEPSRFYVTVPRLILIYLIFRIENKWYNQITSLTRFGRNGNISSSGRSQFLQPA